MVKPSGMELPPYYKYPPPEIRALCRQIVIEVSRAMDVPPGYVTSHIRTKRAVKARALVMRLMLAVGLKRADLAVAFGRDLRRVRCSVVTMTAFPAQVLTYAGRHFGPTGVPVAASALVPAAFQP